MHVVEQPTVRRGATKDPQPRAHRHAHVRGARRGRHASELEHFPAQAAQREEREVVQHCAWSGLELGLGLGLSLGLGLGLRLGLGLGLGLR